MRRRRRAAVVVAGTGWVELCGAAGRSKVERKGQSLRGSERNEVWRRWSWEW